MARSRFFDLLQNYTFWLVDVTPSPRLPFFVLGGGAYGFSSISHPEVAIQTAQIDQLNNPFPHHAFQSATVAPITMPRNFSVTLMIPVTNRKSIATKTATVAMIA